MKIGNYKLSLISSTHYMQLVYRSVLFWRSGSMVCAQRSDRRAVFCRGYRPGYSCTDQPRLRCVRHGLYTVFLPLPDLDPQEQMLRSLQDLQLGLCHDVHAIRVFTECLHLESPCHVPGTAGTMGDHPAHASRVVFGPDER